MAASTKQKADDSWFAIFGADGAPFVKTIINSILGVILVMILVFFTTKIILLIIKSKVTEGEDDQVIIKKQMQRAVAGFIIGAASTSIMIMVINIIPRPAGKVSNSTWFDTFGSSKGEVKKIVNWIMAVLTAIGITAFLITTPWWVVQWMLADEETKVPKMKKIRTNIIAIVVLLTITLGITIIANVIPPPSSI